MPIPGKAMEILKLSYIAHRNTVYQFLIKLNIYLTICPALMPQLSIIWWMDKKTVVHLYNRILLNNKKD